MSTSSDIIGGVEDVVGFTLKELAILYGIPGAPAAIELLFRSLKTGAVKPSQLETFIESLATAVEIAEVDKDFTVLDGSDKK